MTLDSRKLLFCWHPEVCGGIEAIVSKAQRFGITALAFKHDDGGLPFHDSQSVFGLSPGTITRYRDYCREHGIQFGLWGYHYGADWETEAGMVVRAMSFNPDFYIVDWEAEFEQNMKSQANLKSYLQACFDARAGHHADLYHAPLAQPIYHTPWQYQMFQYVFDGMLPQIYHRAMELPLDLALSVCYQDYATYGLTAKPIYPIGQAYDLPANEITAWGVRATSIYGAKGLGWWDLDEATDDMMRAISRVPLEEDNMRRVNGLHPDYINRARLEPGVHGVPIRSGFNLLTTDRRVVLDITVSPVIPVTVAPAVIVKDGDCSYADVLNEYTGYHKNVAVYMHSAPAGVIILEVLNAPVWVEQLGILEAGT